MNEIRNYLVYSFGICEDSGQTWGQVHDQADFAARGEWLQSFNWSQNCFTYRHRLESERYLT